MADNKGGDAGGPGGAGGLGGDVGGLGNMEVDDLADMVPWYMKCLLKCKSCCGCCFPKQKIPEEIPMDMMEDIAPLSIGGPDAASNASNQHQNDGPDETQNNEGSEDGIIGTFVKNVKGVIA